MECEHPDQINYVGCGRCPISYNCEIRKRRLGTPPKPQHGTLICELPAPKLKPLAQYLDEYIKHETGMVDVYTLSGIASWTWLLEQALEAYKSTENVMIQIIKKKER